MSTRARRAGSASGRAAWALALLLAARSGPAAASVLSGKRLMAEGDVARAAEEFAQALADNPADADAATRLGQALAKLGRGTEAEVAYRRAIDLAPARAAAYAALGDLAAADSARWRRRDEIVALLLRGLARAAADDPRRFSLLMSLANFERSVGRTGDARRRLEAIEVGTLPLERRRRVLDLLESVRAEERALALRDWPEPVVPGAALGALAEAEKAFARGETRTVRDAASSLVDRHPGWRGPLWLRARALEALGRHDEAQRDLTVLLQMQPSHAEAWRLLGRTLAVHGGALEAERADRALRRALAFEPAWWDLWLLLARVAVRRGLHDDAESALDRYRRAAPQHATDAEVAHLEAAARAIGGGAARRPASSAPPPSPRALADLRDAQEWLDLGDPAGLATPLLERALRDSPGFVEAASTLYALGGAVPEETLRALSDDGNALLELARRILALGHEDARVLVGPWIDRAVELGTPSARLERAVLRVDGHDRAGALDDLWRYAASDPAPPRLDEARVLVAALAGGPPPEEREALWRADLAEERGEAAAISRCDETTPADRLLPLGIGGEWRADLPAALACYREALRRDPSASVPLARLSGVAARAPLEVLGGLQALLQRAAAAGVADAHLALARLDPSKAPDEIDRYLGLAAPDDPDVQTALAMRASLDDARRGRLRTTMLVVGAAAAAALLLLRFLGGAKLGRALSRHPQLFPEVARIIGELRHDVLKHRSSVLGVAAPAEEIARTLWEPRRASTIVAEAYDGLRQTAAARGVRLRRLGREPVFGPLCRDLERAERLARAGGPAQALAALGARLGALHSERLGALLRMGPRTRLDATEITRWIRDVEAGVRVRGGAWVSPVLHLHGLDLDFPVERSALGTIFSNLLRNAEEAVGALSAPSVLVRLAEERDETGRRLLLLLVGDSSPGDLSLDAIEGREAGRGLAIVRDVVREWRGHLVVRREVAPWSKGVGACFPA